jgi:hypothetical protein
MLAVIPEISGETASKTSTIEPTLIKAIESHGRVLVKTTLETINVAGISAT